MGSNLTNWPPQANGCSQEREADKTIEATAVIET